MFPDSRGEAVMEVAGRLLESVRRTPCGHGGGAISYTFSAGVAEWIPCENLQSLFEAPRNRISGPGVEAEPAERAAITA